MRTMLAFVLSFSIVTSAQAQTPATGGLAELTLEQLLKLTVVAAARHEQFLGDSPRPITVITKEEIWRSNYRTTPEALADSVGVLVQQTNYAGGAPIVRGLVGNRILIMVDGIRLNNSIYRLGPSQYLNTIDVNQIERIEIVPGPGSVLYGSDALGAVINIVTRAADDLDGKAGVRARLFSRFASGDRGVIGRLELSGQAGPFSLLGGAGLKEFGDLRAGSRVGVQPFTGYDESNSDVKTSYKMGERHIFTFAAQRVNQTGVERTDLLNSGSDVKYEIDPQRRTLAYAVYHGTQLTSRLDALTLTVSYQRQMEHFTRVRASDVSIERQQRDEVSTLGVGAQADTPFGARQRLTYGVETSTDHVMSGREDVDLVSGVRRSAAPTYADGSTFVSTAAFLQDEIKLSDRTLVTLGARYSRFALDASVDDPSTGRLDVHARPAALTASAYGAFKITPMLQMIGGVGQGFRAPSVDDLTIFGPFPGGFEVPNPTLQPEKSLNYEAGFRLLHRRVLGTATYFSNDFAGLINRTAGDFDGKSYRDLNENGVQDTREPLIFQRHNAGRARIQGFGGEAQVVLASQWRLGGNLTWTRGEDGITHLPLRRIPPVMGMTRVRWSASARLWVEGSSRFATRQTRLSPGDLVDPLILTGGTPGFVAFNVRGGFDIRHAGRVTAAVQNLTDQTYRTHGSGIDQPGRSLVVGYERSF